MTNVIFRIAQKVIYQQRDLICVTRNIHVIIEALALTVKKLLARLKFRIEWQKDEQMTDSCKYIFRFYTKKNPSLSFTGFPMVW